MGWARKTPKFKEGATVRISKLKGQFDRGFDEQFHKEIFKIKKVFTRLPILTYQLETFDGDEIIEGNFYGNELTAVNPPELFKMEEIIRRKKDSKTGEKMVLVKWRGYRNPSWIPESNVVDVRPVARTFYWGVRFLEKRDFSKIFFSFLKKKRHQKTSSKNLMTFFFRKEKIFSRGA